MKVLPIGHRILIQPNNVEEKVGSFYIPKDVHSKEQQAQVIGLVLAVAVDAYREYDAPWCKEGDKVLYQRYAGMRIPDGNGGFVEGLLLVNDLDVTGIVLEEVTND